MSVTTRLEKDELSIPLKLNDDIPPTSVHFSLCVEVQCIGQSLYVAVAVVGEVLDIKRNSRWLWGYWRT